MRTTPLYIIIDRKELIDMAKKHLTADETAYFCEQLSAMLNSGMQLNDGLDILAEDLDDAGMKEVCGILSEKLYKGSTLFEAMESSGVFPEYAVNMVRIGMVTGRLESVLTGLCEFYENRAETKRTLRSAVLHPLMLLVMMTAVMIVLVIQVIPMFADIFSRFDSSVSDTVSSTIASAQGIGMGILIALLVIIAITGIIALLVQSRSTKRALENFFSNLPVIGKLIRKYSQAKLANAMSIMVSSGIAPEEALEQALLLITDKKLRRQIESCRKKLLDGAYFADAICESGMFPSIYGRSLKIAYTSGSFDTAWKKISDKCSNAAEQTTSGLISFIEPAIIIILAAMIGSILLTILIPLMNIMSVLG